MPSRLTSSLFLPALAALLLTTACGGGGGGDAPSKPVKFARFDAMRSDMVEIVIGDVVVRAGADVEPDRLADVIRAVCKT